jgi:hypothetical protein
VKTAISKSDARLADIYDELYDRVPTKRASQAA